MIKTGFGKLHFPRDEQKPVAIKYRFNIESASSWRGEFTLQEFRRFSDGDGYVIELEDRQRGNCYIRKKVNRVMPATPPMYSYYFWGVGRFEKPKKKGAK